MFLNVFKSSIVLLSVTSLVACSELSNQDIGMVTGGVAGGLLGSQFGGGNGRLVMTGIGTLAGGFIGSVIGKSMDQNDQRKVSAALEQNQTGKTTTWQNPDTGNTYKMKPVKTYQSNNTYCREYTIKATINGKAQNTYGTACRQPDGSWKIKS